jgi:Fe-S-cluster containining protein
MLTIDEIGPLYRHFPITVGFRKYTPADKSRRDFFDMVGERFGDQYIIGDFIAGNWRRKRCTMLSSTRLCRLHDSGQKPLQCRIVPFCAVYPEDWQQVVLAEQHMGAFRTCKGFRAGEKKNAVVWQSGAITDNETRQAFYRYRNAMMRQRGFMQTILDELKELPTFPRFLAGNGILEAPIPGPMLFAVLKTAGLREEEHAAYVLGQAALCQRELESRMPALVFQDSLQELLRLHVDTFEQMRTDRNTTTEDA